MSALEELKRLAHENACCRCQYYENGECKNKGECVWSNIEKELKALEIIKKKNIDLELLTSVSYVYRSSPIEERRKAFNQRTTKKHALSIDEFKLMEEILG